MGIYEHSEPEFCYCSCNIYQVILKKACASSYFPNFSSMLSITDVAHVRTLKYHEFVNFECDGENSEFLDVLRESVVEI